MDATLAKQTDGVGSIPLRWAASTAPDLPVTLPAFVRLSITAEAIHVIPTSTAGPSDEGKPDVEFPKDQLVAVEIQLSRTGRTATTYTRPSIISRGLS